MMANNSSGARSVVYGKTGDHVRGQEVVMADGTTARLGPMSGAGLAAARAGDSLLARAYRDIPALGAAHAAEIDARFPKVMRRVGGYALDAFVDPVAPVDLTRIMVGSEGTLGFVTEATLGLVPLPAAKALMKLEFDELLDALAATPHFLTHGHSAVEVMDDFILGHAVGHPTLEAALRQIVEGDAPTLLCVEFYGDHLDEIVPRMQALELDLARAGMRCRARRLTDAAAQARVWHVRESSLGLSMGMKGDGKAISFVEDSAVPPERLRDYIARFRQIVARQGTRAGVYAHASVGCLHVRPVVNMKTAEGLAQFEAIANDVADLVLEFGGALSGEHGDGLVRGAFNEKMFGSTLYQAFRAVNAPTQGARPAGSRARRRNLPGLRPDSGRARRRRRRHFVRRHHSGLAHPPGLPGTHPAALERAHPRRDEPRAGEVRAQARCGERQSTRKAHERRAAPGRRARA
jgi:FAD/FMN-containing dehydrogenase